MEKFEKLNEEILQGEDQVGKFMGIAIPYNPQGDRVLIMMELSQKLSKKFPKLQFNSRWDFKVEGGKEKYLFYYE